MAFFFSAMRGQGSQVPRGQEWNRQEWPWTVGVPWDTVAGRAGQPGAAEGRCEGVALSATPQEEN